MGVDVRAKPTNMLVVHHVVVLLGTTFDRTAMPAKNPKHPRPTIKVLGGCASIGVSEAGRIRKRLRPSQAITRAMSTAHTVHFSAVVHVRFSAIVVGPGNIRPQGTSGA